MLTAAVLRCAIVYRHKNCPVIYYKIKKQYYGILSKDTATFAVNLLLY